MRDIHAQGIAHRDIKHLNVLIYLYEEMPVAKLTDFGMAAKLKAGDTITKVAGTIGFMAPEVVQDKPSDFKADVWSLGVMLFALICSGVPFPGRDRASTAALIVNSELAFNNSIWETVSDDCKDLITQMLVKDPESRLTAV